MGLQQFSRGTLDATLWAFSWPVITDYHDNAIIQMGLSLPRSLSV
jgi:hypothetical protein